MKTRPTVALCLALAGISQPAAGFVPGGDTSVSCASYLPPQCTSPLSKRRAWAKSLARARCRTTSGRNPGRARHVLFSSSPSPAPSDCPDFVTSPVLRQVYPDLMENLQTYGHPNIPLGTTAGKQCKTLRRLAFQSKLSAAEVELLESIGFRFHAFEDIYEEADFDDCLSRLVEYERANKTGYQIPKKYKEDPELGAWVTMIRRIGRDNIEEDRRKRLDGVGFAWVSTRKCGSSFMKNYRQIRDAIAEGETNDDGRGGIEAVKKNDGMVKWLRAQAEAAAKGNLSQERMEYLDKLSLDLDWRNW